MHWYVTVLIKIIKEEKDMKQKYYVPDWNDKDDCYEFETGYKKEYPDSDTAEAAAADYFDNYNEFITEWPLDFILIDTKGKEYKFEVYMESQPTFSAYKKD